MEHENDLESWVQVDGETHYEAANYLSVARLASIGHQIHLLHRYFPESDNLEIGVGSGLTTQLLKEMNQRVTTLDVDAKLQPDLLGSVTQIPAEDNQFSSFTCCQVLEHISWEDARLALKELQRVTKYGGVISIPTIRRQVSMRFYPKRNRAKMKAWPGTRSFTLPIFGKREMIWAKEHQWELEAGVSTKEFRSACKDVGWNIARDFQPIENPYHHFFVLRSKD